MANLEDLKNIGKSVFEKGKELGGKAIEQGGKALNTAKLNAEILSLESKVKQSKVKIGDMIYQLDVETGINEINELKKQIKGHLEEIKYLETKKENK